MANTQKPDVTPEELAHAQGLWIGFTNLLKWGTIVTISGLALMALFLL